MLTFSIVFTYSFVAEETKNYNPLFQALFVKYWPIETDPVMSVEEKTPYIVEWFHSEMRLMKECGERKSKRFGR